MAQAVVGHGAGGTLVLNLRPNLIDVLLEPGDGNVGGHAVRNKQLVPRSVAVSIFLSSIEILSLMGTVRTLPPFPLIVIAFSRKACSAVDVSCDPSSWDRGCTALTLPDRCGVGNRER